MYICIYVYICICITITIGITMHQGMSPRSGGDPEHIDWFWGKPKLFFFCTFCRASRVNPRLHIHIYIYISTYTCIHIHICVSVYTKPWATAYRRICLPIHMCINMYTHKYMCIYIYWAMSYGLRKAMFNQTLIFFYLCAGHENGTARASDRRPALPAEGRLRHGLGVELRLRRGRRQRGFGATGCNRRACR